MMHLLDLGLDQHPHHTHLSLHLLRYQLVRFLEAGLAEEEDRMQGDC